MKYLIITILLTISINVAAQNEVSDTLINEVSDTFNGKVEGKDIFVRIYNLEGKKIQKGRIKSVSKTSIELQELPSGNFISIPYNEIGKIKTKRSGGNSIAKGAVIGGASGALIGFSQGDGVFGVFTAIDYAIVGLVTGSVMGATVGGITTIFKKSELYIIDGNEIKFKDFKEKLR
jgi:hypothetical protein